MGQTVEGALVESLGLAAFYFTEALAVNSGFGGDGLAAEAEV